MTTIDPPSWYQYLFYNSPLNTPRETAINNVVYIITKANIQQLNQYATDKFHSHSMVAGGLLDTS